MTHDITVEKSTNNKTPNRRAMLGLTAAGTTASLLTLGTNANANAATIARTDLIQAIGFDPILSQLPPSITSVVNLPIYWIQEEDLTDANIDVTPVSPFFDDDKYVWVIPNGVIGVDYKDNNGNSLLPGDVNLITATPYTVTIKAIALPGYQIKTGSVANWTHTFPDFSGSSIITSDTFFMNLHLDCTEMFYYQGILEQ